MRKLLVLTDYPIGYASGFGETLFNLLGSYPENNLWNASPLHLSAAPGKAYGQRVTFIAPGRPAHWPASLNFSYYPILKAQQILAKRRVFNELSSLINNVGISALLTCPVSPWLLTVALRLKLSKPNLKVVFFVMDDWEGHHQTFGLPFTSGRRKTLSNLVALADARFGVSLEMVRKYKNEFSAQWEVLHNGVIKNTLQNLPFTPATDLQIIRLTGDVNVFRMDAVLSFAKGLNLYNRTARVPAQLEISGTISSDCYAPLASLQCVTLLPRTDHANSLMAMTNADLLYLPMSFSSNVQRIADLSLPTKLPEYLNTGKPIFFHAPKASAVYQFAERWGLEPRLACTTPESISKKLEMFNSGHYANNFEQMQAGLETEFDLDILRERLHAAID